MTGSVKFCDDLRNNCFSCGWIELIDVARSPSRRGVWFFAISVKLEGFLNQGFHVAGLATRPWKDCFLREAPDANTWKLRFWSLLLLVFSLIAFCCIHPRGRCRCCAAGVIDRGVCLGDREVLEGWRDPSSLPCPVLRAVQVALLAEQCHWSNRENSCCSFCGWGLRRSWYRAV